MWVNGDNTYVRVHGDRRQVEGVAAGDESWRLAHTSEDVNGTPPVLPAGHNHTPWKFTPPEFVEGKRRSFAVRGDTWVAATRGSLLPLPRRKAARRQDSPIVGTRSGWCMCG